MTKISTNLIKERDSQSYKSPETLIIMVPEVGIEPTWTRGPGDFESPVPGMVEPGNYWIFQ